MIVFQNCNSYLKKQRNEQAEQLQEQIEGLNNADDIMMNIMEVFTQTELTPDAGNYYTFVYNAKTPGVYDEFPLVAVTLVENWGFQGINFHWGTSRNYTWKEIVGYLHVIQNDEIDYLRSLSYANFKTK